jgi:hypothetical protein
MPTVSGIGFGGSIIAAFDHDTFMMWIGVGVSGFGFIMTAVLNSYHKFREIRRHEDEADVLVKLDTEGKIRRKQRELEDRIAKAEQDAVELAARVESVNCAFPRDDGSARCRGMDSSS